MLLVALVFFSIAVAIDWQSIATGSTWWGLSKACDVFYFYNECNELNSGN
jgi:hypothetical protein